ncbi:MAG: alpha/beta fold hydrolase [Verrucomicrobiota bacterium]
MKDDPEKKRHIVKVLISWVLHSLLITLAVVMTIVLVSAFASRNMPTIEKWHHQPFKNEFVAKDLTEDYGFEQYLELEESMFKSLADYMLDPDKLEGHSPYSRFVNGGSQDPARQPVNWNRTVELLPSGKLKGGVLLLHGLSDSPYSLRSQAELFYSQGFYVLVMRMPGHGTVPAGLLNVTWQDWAAAVQLGAKHVRDKVGGSLPFYIGGYSNGGALAVQHSLAAVVKGEPVPDQLFLFSPAIGITGFARAAWWDSLYGFIPYFEKSNWLGIELEYDPYKYNSFTKNAGTQSWELANEINARLMEVKEKRRMDRVPLILAFQSVVDATVEARVLVSGLFDHLETEGNEVVFFDINRSEQMDSFLSLKFAQKLDALMKQTDLKYTVTKVTNRDRQTHQISAHSRLPGVAELEVEELDFKWPVGVYSLAHVAIPFPADDPLYGGTAPEPPVFGLNIGSFHPIGEKHVLKIPPSQLIRIRYNPFHPYINERMMEVVEKDLGDGR